MINCKRIRVLLADDNKKILAQVSMLLEPEFDVIRAVANGAELVNSALELKPDVCITDISMPVLNGIEAARSISDKVSNVKTIILTVHEDPDYLEATLVAGADGYVVKSRMVTDLARAIRDVVAGKRFISPCRAFPNII